MSEDRRLRTLKGANEMMYSNNQLGGMDLSILKTASEVRAFMEGLDELISSIEISRKRRKHISEGGLRALKALKRRRQAAQDAFGLINRQKKEARHQTKQAAFVEAAMKVLDPDTITEIWDKVHKDNPDIRSFRSE